MTRRGVLIGAIAALTIGAGWMTSPRSIWRYKMAIEIETPEGLRSGSSVREVTYQAAGSFWFAESRPQWRVKGEAIPVELPDGHTIYALLVGSEGDVNYGARIADRALGVKGGRVTGWPGPVELFPTHPKTHGLAQTSPLPMLVTFADPQKPESVEGVDQLRLQFTKLTHASVPWVRAWPA